MASAVVLLLVVLVVDAASCTRCYHRGGLVGGRRMPGGWYWLVRHSFWKGALLGGTAAFGGAMLFIGLADAIGGGFGENDWAGGGLGRRQRLGWRRVVTNRAAGRP